MIQKAKTLTQQLKEMTLFEEIEVKSKVYKTASIRVAVTALRKKGYDFVVTEKGIYDGCKVTRTR